MESSPLSEQVISRRSMFDGVIIHVEHWQVALPDGSTGLREVVLHNGAAAVAAVDDEGQLILVRQARPAVDRLTLQIPAGKLDSPDEDPLHCAVRELSEETGLLADHWQKLTCMQTTPGFCSERIHLYLATGLHQGPTHPDEGEFVQTLRMPLQEAVDRVMNGSIRDGKTMTGILMAARALSPDQ